MLVTLNDSNVVLNEPAAFTSVGPGVNLDVTIDLKDISVYNALFVTGVTYSWTATARHLTSGGAVISSAATIIDTLVPSAVQASVKVKDIKPTSTKVTLRFTNGEATSQNAMIYVYGRRGA